MFQDRIDAGTMLAEKLLRYKNEPGIVLAVPRGGVPVAVPIAEKLGFPLHIVLTKRIGHPLNKEYAIGAATLTDYFVLPHEMVADEYLETEVRDIRKKLSAMQRAYPGNDEPLSLKDKTVIVADDGIATGNTMLATLHLLKKSKPRKLVVAVPVASAEGARKVSAEADDFISLLVPAHFQSVGNFYFDFAEVSDSAVIEYLTRLQRPQRKA